MAAKQKIETRRWRKFPHYSWLGKKEIAFIDCRFIMSLLVRTQCIE